MDILPEWYSLYEYHYNYWNIGYISDNEHMSISFIPKGNSYTFGIHLEIMNTLKDIISDSGYDIKIIKKKEGGFQLFHENFELNDKILQIRCNLSEEVINDSNINDIMEPLSNKSGINVIKFTATKYIPRKVMLHLYNIIEQMDMLIFKAYGFPNKNDSIIWGKTNILTDNMIPQ
jgi:hypothetical protein